MAVYSSNLIIKTGTTFEQVFTLEDGVSNSPINLTNFGVSAQMRKHRGDNTQLESPHLHVRYMMQWVGKYKSVYQQHKLLPLNQADMYMML